MSVEGQEAADPRAAVAARLLAHAARATRFAGARPDAVQRDLLAPSIYRLTDRQRASVTLMLEALTSEILDAVCTPFEQTLGKDIVLGPFGLSEDPELVAVALRAADLHHIETGLRHAAYNDDLEGPGLLQRVVDDADPKLIEAANAFLAQTTAMIGEEDEPRLSRSDLPPRLDHRLIWEMAEKVAADAVERHGISRSEADQALARSAMAALNAGEGGALGAALRLVDLYQEGASIDDAFVLDALIEGRLPLVLAALARRTGIDTDELSLMFTEADLSRLVLALRLAGLSRKTAAHLLSRLFTATGRYAPQDDARLEECLSGFEAVSPDVAALALGVEPRP